MKQVFIHVLIFLGWFSAHGQSLKPIVITDSTSRPVGEESLFFHLGRKGPPTLQPVGIQPVVQEMRLQEKRHVMGRRYNCGIQSVQIIVDGLPADFGEGNRVPKNPPYALRYPLTYRTYKNSSSAHESSEAAPQKHIYSYYYVPLVSTLYR